MSLRSAGVVSGWAHGKKVTKIPRGGGGVLQSAFFYYYNEITSYIMRILKYI